MCFGVAPSGFPIPKSMMSSPRLRAAAFNSLVMLNTYAGSRVSLRNSSIPVRLLLSVLFLHDATAPTQSQTGVPRLPTAICIDGLEQRLLRGEDHLHWQALRRITGSMVAGLVAQC